MPPLTAGLEARDPWIVGPAARAALLQAVHGHPTQACVLWLTCTHMLAFGVLPERALHRCAIPHGCMSTGLQPPEIPACCSGLHSVSASTTLLTPCFVKVLLQQAASF